MREETLNNIIGYKYGKLTVTGVAPTPEYIKNPKEIYVYCDCECGNKNVIKRWNNIRSHLIYSCGCEYHKIGKRYKSNEFCDKGDYIIGYDSKGKEFYISKEDYEKVKEYTWFVNISRNNEVVNASNNIKLHRYIMDVNESDKDVDHINHIRNDNRRENLRIVSRTYNNANHGIRSDNTTGYIGVHFNKKTNKWYAKIGINKKQINLGTYENIDDAIHARKLAEEKYFGEYSYDNSKIIAKNNMLTCIN